MPLFWALCSLRTAAAFHAGPERNHRLHAGVAAIASLAIGPIIDNFGKKTGLVAGFALITLAMFAVAGLGTYGYVMALFLLLGLGGGMIVTGANALVSDISEARRGTVLNLLNLFFGLGDSRRPCSAR